MSEYEPFCMYGLHILYPITWKIEVDPKSERIKGNVVFKSPEKTSIFVSWGPLEKAKKRCPSIDEFVEDAVNRIKKTRGVKEVELIQTKFIQINSHKAKFTHIRVVIISGAGPIPFMKAKTSEQEIRSLHLYCRNSARYFIIYGETTPDESLKHGSIFEGMIKSFKCHQVKANISNPIENELTST